MSISLELSQNPADVLGSVLRAAVFSDEGTKHQVSVRNVSKDTEGVAAMKSSSRTESGLTAIGLWLNELSQGLKTSNVAELQEKLDSIAAIVPLIQSSDAGVQRDLHKINKDLMTKTFLIDEKISLSDVIFAAAVHKLISSWDELQRTLFCNITRHFNFIQNQPGVLLGHPILTISTKPTYPEAKSKPAPASKTDAKQLEATDKAEKADKGAKKPSSSSTAAPAAAAAVASSSASSEKPTDNAKKPKEKKDKVETPAKDETPAKVESAVNAIEEKVAKANQEASATPKEKVKKEKSSAAATPSKSDEGSKESGEPKLVDISRMDIRVGRITDCRKHEAAENLLVEQIDVGDGDGVIRQVVSGLAKFYEPNAMIGKSVLVICNLKASNFKGVKSEGMVLCASDAEHVKVELVEPPASAKPGTVLKCSGYDKDPADASVDPKKKGNPWTDVSEFLKTDAQKRVCFRGVPMTAEGKDCLVPTLSDSKVA